MSGFWVRGAGAGDVREALRVQRPERLDDAARLARSEARWLAQYMGGKPRPRSRELTLASLALTSLAASVRGAGDRELQNIVWSEGRVHPTEHPCTCDGLAPSVNLQPRGGAS